jgi:hypothetical protein
MASKQQGIERLESRTLAGRVIGASSRSSDTAIGFRLGAAMKT